MCASFHTRPVDPLFWSEFGFSYSLGFGIKNIKVCARSLLFCPRGERDGVIWKDIFEVTATALYECLLIGAHTISKGLPKPSSQSCTDDMIKWGKHLTRLSKQTQ